MDRVNDARKKNSDGLQTHLVKNLAGFSKTFEAFFEHGHLVIGGGAEDVLHLFLI